MALDVDALAANAGTDAEMIDELVRLALLPEGDTDVDSLVPRVRLLIELERSGIAASDVARAIQTGGLTLESVDLALAQPDSVVMLDISYGEHAYLIGLSEEASERVLVALGIPIGSEARLVRNDDAEAMQVLAELIDLGVDEELTVRFFENIADNLRRVARASSEMWNAAVKDPLRASGLSHAEVLEAQTTDGERYRQIVPHIVNVVWSRFLDDEIYRGTMESLESALVDAGVHRSAATEPPSIVFVDLTAFTNATIRDGDEVAAAGARELSSVVKRVSVSNAGVVVKMLGDGAMVYFRRSSDAVRFSLQMIEQTALAGLPPARAGVSSGPIIARDVDYYGQTVNTAARLVDYARPNEVLVTSAVVDAVNEEDLAFNAVGPVSLKGVDGLVTVVSAAWR